MTSAHANHTATPGQCLRILFSAYACEPHNSSEPGTGWRWAVALAQAGHEVWVLTCAGNRPAIDKALKQFPRSRLHFAYYDLPRWARWWNQNGRYLLWQFGACRVARRLCRKVEFDVAHHITCGVFRYPALLAFLNLPFVFGPVCRGERAPCELRETFPLRGYLGDLVRDAANWAVRIDPLMALVYRRSAAMVCRTRETIQSIPARYRQKCVVQAEVGTDPASWPEVVRARPRVSSGLRVLYVGALVYWEGLHLGLMAFAMFRQRQPAARLTVVGSGSDAEWLHRIAWLLGIDASITWMPQLEQAEVISMYPRHDVFLFPSLHDSGGNVVLDALSCGVPVVSLDAGSAAVLVDSSCGVKVLPGNAEEVVAQLADALFTLAGDPDRLQLMSEAAVRRAREEFAWPRQAARMGDLYRAVRVKHDSYPGATAATA